MREPNIDFVVTNEEWQLLKDEDPALFKLYSALRRLIDFDTGIAGTKYQLTLQYLIQSLTIKKSGSRKKYIPSHYHIRDLLVLLEELGLIKNCTDPNQKRGTYKYHLMLARVNKINKPRTNLKQTSNKPQVIHRGHNDSTHCIDKVPGSLSTDLKVRQINDKPETNLRQTSSLILDTELQNTDIQNSLSSSKPPKAPAPSAKSSETQKPERENLNSESQTQEAKDVIAYLDVRRGTVYSTADPQAWELVAILLGRGISIFQLKDVIDLRLRECVLDKDQYLLAPRQLFHLDYIGAHLAKLAPIKAVSQTLSPQCCYHHPEESPASHALCDGAAPEGQAELYEALYGLVVCQWHADVIMAARKDVAAQRRVDALLTTLPEEVIGGIEVGENGIPRFSSIFKKTKTPISGE